MIALLERSGVDRDRALAFLVTGMPAGPFVKAVAPRMASRDYTPHFLLKLMGKDLRYAIQEATAHGMKLTTAECALETVNRAVAAGHGEKDLSAAIEPLRSLK
jgi:3-hydroxyisobutyrate dehydrogenase